MSLYATESLSWARNKRPYMSISTGTLIPALQYKDAPAAIEWFCAVLGFKQKLVVPAGPQGIAHAQLTLGSGMIMLSSFSDTEYSKLVTTVTEAGGKNTQTCLLYIADTEIEAHYNQAVAAGAEVLVSLRSEEYGGRYYSVKDPEGHLWSIGSYDPYA